MSGKQCKTPGCGSHAVNPHLHGREPGADLDLCDICYWRTRAEKLLEERDIEAGLAEQFRKALYVIADGDAQTWPGCSSRRVAALALGRAEDDINRG